MKVTLIGSGNLATSLAFALVKAKHDLVQIYSRTETSAQLLAEKVGVQAFTSETTAINKESDIYIVSISDAALERLIPKLTEGREHALWVHTAGSMHMDVFQCQRRGVFYPMQTFSKQKIVDFATIPIFLEAHVEDDLQLLHHFASTLSHSIYHLNSNDRPFLHLAAVFCCNFANHCSTLAAKLLKRHDIPFEVMLPLIDETTQKLHKLTPADAQTGPAIRHDKNVMDKHMKMLRNDHEPHLAYLYELLSQSIQQQ